ncbi:MAG: hypothetical protein R3A45_12055 [Bdellovibrionota bacterium]
MHFLLPTTNSELWRFGYYPSLEINRFSPFLIKGIEDQSPIVLKRLAMSLQEFPSTETKTSMPKLSQLKYTKRSVYGTFLYKVYRLPAQEDLHALIQKTMANVEKNAPLDISQSHCRIF